MVGLSRSKNELDSPVLHRKVLACYIVVAVSFFTVGCVGPNPSGNEHPLGGRSVCVHTMAPSSRSIITSVVSVGNVDGKEECYLKTVGSIAQTASTYSGTRSLSN